MSGASPPRKGERVGIIAGRGAYPIELCGAIAARGIEVSVACLGGQTDPRRFGAAASVRVFPLGALRAIADFLRASGAVAAYMAGGVERRGAILFARPDPWSLSLLPRALFGRDDRLLRAVAKRFAALGISIRDPRPFLCDILATRGLIAGPPPDDDTTCDLRVAQAEARRAGVNGRGQAALAFRGRAAGVEDRSGTDALLARAPGPGAVLAKVAAEGQDERFDLPAIGPSTIRIARAVRLAAIGLEAGRTLILSRPRVVELCDTYGISLVGLTAVSPGAPRGSA
jgi:UDP-2,3-diacylglucosamine hydrolase